MIVEGDIYRKPSNSGGKASTYISLHCTHHGTYFETRLSHYKSGASTCKGCQRLQMLGNCSTHGMLERLVSIAPKDLTFCPNGSIWGYKCSVCGFFKEAPYDKLIRGQMGCRCRGGFKWSSEDRCAQVERIISSSANLSQYVLEKYITTIDSQLRVTCNLHGDFTCTINNFVNHGSRCPKCTSLYIIKGREMDADFLYLIYNRRLKLYKVGRSFQPERRLGIINREFGGWCIVDLVEMKHEDVCRAERLILEGTYNFLPKSCPRFRGYTEVRDFKHLEGEVSLENLQKTVSGELD